MLPSLLTMAHPFGLKQFRAECCLSYVLWDRETREALIVDPEASLLDDFREFFAENRLRPTLAIDTHTHADHFSATHCFRDEFGAQVGMSHRTRSLRPSLRLKHGQELGLGRRKIRVLEAPGHTPDSICLLADGLLFTGDTLMIGSTGRTDFPGSDPEELHRTLHEALGGLPGETVVLPGHDYNGMLFTTLATERASNPQLAVRSLEEFAKLKRQELVSICAPELSAMIEYNQLPSPGAAPVNHDPGPKTACGTPIADEPRFAAISVEKYAHKLEEKASGQLFLDVREPSEFADGHMPGVRGIPLSELALYLPELRRAARIYVSCLSGRRSGMAAKTLTYLGCGDVVNVSGGYKAWTQAGLPVEK